MKMRVGLGVAFALAMAASLSAHIMVSPPESKAGAMQKYEVRVHNEGKVVATGIELDIPEDLMVMEVAQPASGTFTTKKLGDHITSISWQIDVQPNKYLALPFTAMNPAAPKEVQWSIREHLADGSVVEWSNKTGAKEKGSVTKIK